MSDSARPFVVLGVQQIAIGGLDRRELRELWVECLGATPLRTFVSADENVDEEVLSLGLGDRSFELDLMQPLDPNARPRVHEPALNHVGLWVDDLRAAVTWLSARGVRFAGGIRKGANGHEICFIHPKASPDAPLGGGGVLIELVQAPPEIIGSRPAGSAQE